jgi:hypothetical protein
MSQNNSDESPDKSKEYFDLKQQLKLIRGDVRDLKTQHERWQELEAINKKAKEIRDEIKESDGIRELEEKAKAIKERMELMKEIIRIQLIENHEVEIKQDGKVLKLVYVLKEAKEEDN